MNGLTFALLSALVCATLAFRQQSVGIRGRLMCGDKPLANTQVKLWNKNKIGDKYIELLNASVYFNAWECETNSGTDDQLAAAKTDAQGNFQLNGGVGSVFGMDVHFKVYHDCDDGITPCQRKVDLKVPDQYVTRSENVQKWFDAGVMNMEFKFPDEERSCIN
ncbi:Transthyretin-like family protein [Aphelenchoides avenae]|nr:Transthyretin-like family protein [Aphelenchus avenae]